MLNKYYNNSQKHVEKCSESFEDFRNISFIEHSRFIFDISSSGACMPVSSIYVRKKNSGQLINYPCSLGAEGRERLNFLLVIWF